MEQEQRKLTLRSASRYDRSKDMSDTATIERSEKDQAREAWAEALAGAKDPATRSAIQTMINMGMTPDDTDKDVEEITKDYVDEEFQKIKERERKQRDRTKLEKGMDKYVESLANAEKGKSHPQYGPEGENGIKMHEKKTLEEINWDEIGWAEAERAEVERKLQQKFGWEPESDRIQNAIDLLIAGGKTAAQVASEIDPSPGEFELTIDDQKKLDNNPRLTPDDIINSKKINFFARLHVDPQYAKRFLFMDEFVEENDSDFQRDPKNIEEVAWQIMHHFTHTNWGPHGKFPLMEMRIAYKLKKNEKGEETKEFELKNGKLQVDQERSKYYVNQSNFIRWARERMWDIYDVKTHEPLDFFSAIHIPKLYGTIDFGRMFMEWTKYFASEDKDTLYAEMAQELIVEAWGLGALRGMDAQWLDTMPQGPDKQVELIGQLFKKNDFTKEVFRKNLFALMTLMPLNFEGKRPHETPNFDGIFGASMIDMFLVYYNLGDLDELKRLLGPGATFFTKQGYVQALQTVVKDKVFDSSGELKPTILGADCQEWFKKAFDDKTGQIVDEKSFINLINFFAYKTNDHNAEYTVRRMLYRMVAEKYGRVLREEKKDENGNTIIVDRPKEKIYMHGETNPIEMPEYGFTADEEGLKDDEWTLKMAWVAAFSMARVFGAGMRNDVTAQAYDQITKLHNTEIWRDKYINKNSDESGNPYTIHMFKMFAMDPMNAIVTRSFDYARDENGNKKYKRDEHGKLLRDSEGKPIPIMEEKSWMEVLREMQATMTAYSLRQRQIERELRQARAAGDMEKVEGLVQELEKHTRNLQIEYKQKAGQQEFKARAMSNYYDDHLMRAHEIWNHVMKAEEFEMEKYVTYDAWGGVSFDREEFQKDVQHQFIHPIRYFLSTYPDVRYNKKMRMLDQAATIQNHGTPVYRDMTLGEAMFGHALVDRGEFWKRDPRTGKPINIRDQKGRKMKGTYEIDWDKVEANKTLLWKQWFLTKIAADLWAHRSYHAPDKRFDLNYYNNVIKAIESIPGHFDADEYSIRQGVVTKSAFDKEDMEWLKKNVKIENYDLFLRAFFKDILLPEEKEEGIGLLLALSLATRSIIKQGG